MAAGKRMPHETMEEYRNRLKQEEWAIHIHLGGRIKRKKVPLLKRIKRKFLDL